MQLAKKLKREDDSKKSIFDRTDSQNPFLNKILKEDQIILERIKELVRLLKLKYNVAARDIIYLAEEKEILIPVSIFTKKLRVLETLTKYLKEELELSYHQIGILLNRDERNIWHTYNYSRKKYPDKLKITVSKYFIPVSIFQNKLGALENIVLYLKDELNLSYHNIAELLERDDRTIWAMYNRAKNKLKYEK
ncbi:MAG: hypothetical protein AABX08_01655 [Nanoarchaeota archaeon]